MLGHKGVSVFSQVIHWLKMIKLSNITDIKLFILLLIMPGEGSSYKLWHENTRYYWIHVCHTICKYNLIICILFEQSLLYILLSGAYFRSNKLILYFIFFTLYFVTFSPCFWGAYFRIMPITLLNKAKQVNSVTLH